jgi:hypothetical protein
MPIEYQINNTNQTIQVEDKPFASGGEGDLYRVISDPNGYAKAPYEVVKIYKRYKGTNQKEKLKDIDKLKIKEKKLKYLISNRPKIQYSKEYGISNITWIDETVYEKGQFVGFTMFSASGITLDKLCLPKIPKNYQNDYGRFSLDNTNSLELRLKLCFNIADALFHIHLLKKYALVDMKPENIMVHTKGIVSIIDIDSIAVIENGIVLYPAPVATPEYSPPEYHTSNTLIPSENWDRFSAAVIFYKLLFGIHPFQGTCKGNYENCLTIEQKIEKNLFIQSNKQHFSVIPHHHEKWNKIDKNLHTLFIKAFSNQTDRPSIEVWRSTIGRIIGVINYSQEELDYLKGVADREYIHLENEENNTINEIKKKIANIKSEYYDKNVILIENHKNNIEVLEKKKSDAKEEIENKIIEFDKNIKTEISIIENKIKESIRILNEKIKDTNRIRVYRMIDLNSEREYLNECKEFEIFKLKTEQQKALLPLSEKFGGLNEIPNLKKIDSKNRNNENITKNEKKKLLIYLEYKDKFNEIKPSDDFVLYVTEKYNKLSQNSILYKKNRIKGYEEKIRRLKQDFENEKNNYIKKISELLTKNKEFNDLQMKKLNEYYLTISKEQKKKEKQNLETMKEFDRELDNKINQNHLEIKQLKEQILKKKKLLDKILSLKN